MTSTIRFSKLLAMERQLYLNEYGRDDYLYLADIMMQQGYKKRAMKLRRIVAKKDKGAGKSEQPRRMAARMLLWQV